ncbi:hypothetical protein RJ55_05328 [Drechmeria coniospora]|nr:hypothetical protein RJ55_05328 [Drechmeria coniospora]
MKGDAGLIGCLVDRVATRLPRSTGTCGPELDNDDILRTTRETLVNLSKAPATFGVIADSLLALLQSFARPFASAALASHPPHVLQSELYIVALLADCFSSSCSRLTARGDAAACHNPPPPLADDVVSRLFDLLKQLLDPIPDQYVLPAQLLVEQIARRNLSLPLSDASRRQQQRVDGPASAEVAASLVPGLAELDAHIQTIVESATASNWSASFAYVKNVIYGIRNTSFPDATSDPSPSSSMAVERSALVTLRLLSFFCVDDSKLGLIIQEICPSYLHFCKPCQNTIAVVLPLLITSWIDRCPHQFVRLHTLHKKLDGAVDTLFDMTQTGVDVGKRKTVLYPLQLTLVLLLPDVFQVAGNMKEARSNSVVKKVAFLDALRKALWNGNEQAGYCLVTLLRAARHFTVETDSALVSYALDVQDEVKNAIFSMSPPSSPSVRRSFDQEMITGAFVSLVNLNLNGCVDTLIDTCIAPSAPNRFKIALVQACSYFATRSQDPCRTALLDVAVPFMRAHLQKHCDRFIVSPKDEPQKDGVGEFMYAVMRFLEAFPNPLLEEMTDGDSESDFVKPLLFCAFSPDSSIRRLATDVARRILVEAQDCYPALDAERQLVARPVWDSLRKQSSKVLLSLCDGIKAQNNAAMDIRELHRFLEGRLILFKAIPGLIDVLDDVPETMASSSKLETTLLVSLCTADIDTCQIVTSCIRYVLEEQTLRMSSTSSKTISSVLRNRNVYQELTSPAFRFTGTVAFQKRMRSLLRQMEYPTAGVLAAWETAFERWLPLAKQVSTPATDPVDDTVLSEWRNYSGFLASLGGVCASDQRAVLGEPLPGDFSSSIDRGCSVKSWESSLAHYLKLSIQLLASSKVKVREAMREVLSTEVSSVLYSSLFRALESELNLLFTAALGPSDKRQDGDITFAEQTAYLLKAMVERLESPTDLGAASSVHLGALALNFAKFIDGVSDGSAPRVKIRVCNLCEAVTKRKEHLNLRDDVRIRNQLLECIVGWIARPQSTKQEQLPGAAVRQDDGRRIQKDLDKACLKSLAHLTFRLPLQPADSQTDAGTSELKSEMFHSYFNRFLSLLNHDDKESGGAEFQQGLALAVREDVVSNSDLVITILSNLLSANIDVGLKHSLNIGYHENIEIRTAFVKVLYNILIQGTEFSRLTDAGVSEKYEELLKLLTTDLSLPVSMSFICPASEVDQLSLCLLTIFEQRGLIYDLLEALVQHEIHYSENESEILRRSSVTTKILSIYAKWKGVSYLKATLQNVVERLMITSQDLDLELDPARVGSPDELQQNAIQLQIVAKVFMDDICASSSLVPASFRKICCIISEAVSSRFPNSKYTAVGAFMFLRFICPAIVAPESASLISTPPTKQMRRGLLLIAKIIQNLANNALFGSKEPYMFPLNAFLVQNIHLVTGFLREISVPPEHMEVETNLGLLDFGSCVVLHRFLYDHWDHLRQTLVTTGGKGFVRSPEQPARGAPAMLEPLRNLVTNLGPLPLAISWNRPHISSNIPPIYSRFQNFMLRNAFKGTESFLTSRAVYDGGESKDGLSIVCVILRHIENEIVDYDTLLFCYLKIASRLWQEPFGLFIDATCYNGRGEPPDEFFDMLDLLAPSELSLNLSRIYVYNMNSAFKRCFRRLLRVCTKNENSVFHPKNVDYHLIGTLQGLQTHFHLSQLHLPQETISVVTDTRYMFQRVTRLSKSKGKVEVVIKIGSEFVQVTTAKKHELLSGFRLNSTVNDIFRLADIDEATTPVQANDDSAFGLRVDGGRVVMFFTSPEKADLLQTIHTAKGKYGKDTRLHKPPERLVRPQDVPGTMLNLALTNLASHNPLLRLASYNLLGALCRAFDYGSANRLIYTKDLSVPMDPTRFIAHISKELAHTEPQLTLDFLTEFFVGWESFLDEQKSFSLEYMAPWISNLRTSVLAGETDGEKGREKVANLFRKLIDLAVQDQSLMSALQHHVWPPIGRDEALLEIFVDELTKTSLSYDARAETADVVTSIMASLGTMTVRGKVLSRLRKAINRSSVRPTRVLAENMIWSEICILLRFCLALSFDSGVQTQMFLPEVFHVVTMLANTGEQEVRTLVYRLLVNTVHAACSSFILDDAQFLKLRGSLESLCEPRADIFSMPFASSRDAAAASTTSQDSALNLAATENLAALLFELCSIAAPAMDVANAWRSRWMSLVASTAFQNNPAIQPRAFAVMGYLARDEVDDDLLYQVLVALRKSVNQFREDGNSEMLISIITCLSKMMSKLPSASRYGLQLFWLAMSLVRLMPAGLFNCTARFLEATLLNIGTIGNVRGERMVPLLLQSRAQLEEVALPLDEAYGIRFDGETFHYAVCACLVGGLADTTTRLTAIRVLSSFLDMTTWTGEECSDGPGHSVHGSPYLALMLARCMGHEDFVENLWWAGIKTTEMGDVVCRRGNSSISSLRSRDAILMTALELVDFHGLEDAAQARSLHWLFKLASERRDIFVRLCGAMPSILNGVLLHGQEPATLEAAHLLLRTLTSDGNYSSAMGSTKAFVNVLDGLGFRGLWRDSSAASTEGVKQECFEMTEKLIELIIL